MQTLSTMTRTGVLAASMLLLASGMASAQSRTIESKTVTMTATIEAIEPSTRTLTLKNADGLYETLQALPEIKRFSDFKIGDKITAHYYENVVVVLKRPGEAAVDLQSGAVTPREGGPGGTAARQRTITVTVTAVDPTTSSVTVRGPNGYIYRRKVTDKKAFELLKIGDQLDMIWTEAQLVSVDAPSK